MQMLKYVEYVEVSQDQDSSSDASKPRLYLCWQQLFL